jgi:DNA repair protein RecO (recombination protein O)
LDLFAEGQAQLQTKAGRDLHTLVSFDVVESRPQLATDLDRFTAASAFGECVLRVVTEDSAPGVYAHVVDGFARIERSRPETAVGATLGALWRVVAEAGFAPTLDLCASCEAAVADDRDVAFSHVAGGVLCDRCAALAPGSRARGLPRRSRQAPR